MTKPPLWQVRHCRAHQHPYPCWLVRTWQAATRSYVHHSSRRSWEEAMRVTQLTKVPH